LEIVWLGHACFRIKGKETNLITDPFPKNLGYSLGRVTADIVTVSHPHAGHSYVEGVGGDPKVVRRPGEYEIGNVLINGFSTFHDDEQGKRLGKNTVYLMEIDQVLICHLGDLGHIPTSDQVGELSGVEVLLVPVGGKSTLDGAAAARTVRLLEPRLVIPMHFKTPATSRELEPVDRFLKEMGLKDPEPQDKLSVTKSNLPPNTQVVLLEHR
jgi:L-ascorbate metabolism protein UlaG (beta-lactamase superfamily)